MVDAFDLRNLMLSDDCVMPARRVEPRKLKKRRKNFVQVPWEWIEKLNGATGKTWHLAMHLLYLDWKDKGAPIKLANGMLGMDGVDRDAKSRGLSDLERRGLITVERRPKKSPIVKVILPKVSTGESVG